MSIGTCLVFTIVIIYIIIGVSLVFTIVIIYIIIGASLVFTIVIIYVIIGVSLVQGCSTGGPRAGCGPSPNFIQPPRDFTSLEFFVLIFLPNKLQTCNHVNRYAITQSVPKNSPSHASIYFSLFNITGYVGENLQFLVTSL